MSNFNKTVLETFGVTHTLGRFGIELEVEGARLPNGINADWLVHNEPSLRNNGLEYVLRAPMNLDQLPNALAFMERAFAASTIRNTYRTSTHIHVNMQSETLMTVLRYLMLWTVVEQLVCRLAGPQRDGNLFCITSQDTGDLPAGMRQFARAIRTGKVLETNPRGKYSSLNIQPLWRFGSVECRVFPLSLNAVQLMTWVRWLDRLFTLAKSDQSILSFLDTAISTPEELLNRVFGPGLAHINENLEMIRSGAENTYEVMTAVEEELKRVGEKVYKKSELGFKDEILAEAPEGIIWGAVPQPEAAPVRRPLFMAPPLNPRQR